jgi:uncharacterized FlaG/YvyC family protein
MIIPSVLRFTKPENMQNKKDISPKLQQFTDELNALLAKYQYKLEPEISVTSKGISPVISIKEVLPPKGKPALKKKK